MSSPIQMPDIYIGGSEPKKKVGKKPRTKDWRKQINKLRDQGEDRKAAYTKRA